MKKTEKTLILICIIITIVMCVFLFGYNLDREKQMKLIQLNKDIELTETKNDIDYNIDSIEISDGICNVKGWAIIKGVSSYNVIPNIILKDDSGNLYKIRTRILQRTDITQQYNGDNTDKIVYDNCGISSEVNASDLNEDKNYKIGIQLKVNDESYFVWTSSMVKL